MGAPMASLASDRLATTYTQISAIKAYVSARISIDDTRMLEFKIRVSFDKVEDDKTCSLNGKVTCRSRLKIA